MVQAPALLLAPIHPSAWKECSPKFGCRMLDNSTLYPAACGHRRLIRVLAGRYYLGLYSYARCCIGSGLSPEYPPPQPVPHLAGP